MFLLQFTLSSKKDKNLWIGRLEKDFRYIEYVLCYVNNNWQQQAPAYTLSYLQ